MKKRTAYLMLTVVACCAVMAVTDGVIKPGYWVKSGVKLLLFLGVPLLFARKQIEWKKLLIPDRKGLGTALLLGAILYGLILGGYLLLRNVFDFSGITGKLADGVGVRRDNFVFVALYISFCNSFLEEFFFRGVAYLTLRRRLDRRWARAFSSVMFAAYHIAIMDGWFSPALFALTMVGLTAGGWIFDLLDEKSGNIYRSWIVHMFTNFAINTVGFLLFAG